MQIKAEYAYSFPCNVEEAAGCVLRGALVMAGGSDLMPRLKMELLSPEEVVDISRVPGLSGITVTGEGIRIGAMTTLDTIARNKDILAYAPILSQAARNVASPQIRNRGTIAGNLLQSRRCFYYNQPYEWRQGIPVCRKLGGDVCLQIQKSSVCRAIYYSDMAPALLACDAVAEVYTDQGCKLMPVEEIVRLHCKDALGPLLITALLVPKSACEGTALFRKYSVRGGVDFPVINFAASVRKNGLVRFLVGAVAPEVISLTSLEEYIAARGTEFDLEEACGMAVKEMEGENLLIREAGISVPVKRSSFLQVRGILSALKEELKKAE